MMTTLEKEYGDALYSLAQDENCLDEALEGLTLAVAAFRENPGYLTLIQNPALVKEERLELLGKAFAGIHPYVLNFLKLRAHYRLHLGPLLLLDRKRDHQKISHNCKNNDTDSDILYSEYPVHYIIYYIHYLTKQP